MMNLPENRNSKGEDVGKFVAEMLALSKSPAMRPYLTETEARRQEQDRKREAEEERKKWEEEARARDKVTGEWFDLHMKTLAPRVWKKFQATKDPATLKKGKWELEAHMGVEKNQDGVLMETTICGIFKRGKTMKMERLVWKEYKPKAEVQ